MNNEQLSISNPLQRYYFLINNLQFTINNYFISLFIYTRNNSFISHLPKYELCIMNYELSIVNHKLPNIIAAYLITAQNH